MASLQPITKRQHSAATPHVVVPVSLATHAEAYRMETTEVERIVDEHI